MRSRPTRNDVARLAGVSVATVAHVVNGGPKRVLPETRDRVLAAIRELGYRPHALARSLRSGSSRTVGFLVPSLLSYFVTHLVSVLEDELSAAGYELIVASSHEDWERERRLLAMLVDRSVDGLLLMPVSSRIQTRVRELDDFGIPLVLVDRNVPDVNADVVMTDDAQVASSLTQRLLDQGCRDLALISFSDEASSARARALGFRLAVDGVPNATGHVHTAHYASGESPFEAIHGLLGARPKLDAIVASAEALLAACLAEARIREVSGRTKPLVAGFVSALEPWRTLVEDPPLLALQDAPGIARLAARRILERMAGAAEPPRQDVVPTVIWQPTSA